MLVTNYFYHDFCSDPFPAGHTVKKDLLATVPGVVQRWWYNVGGTHGAKSGAHSAKGGARGAKGDVQHSSLHFYTQVTFSHFII